MANQISIKKRIEGTSPTDHHLQEQQVMGGGDFVTK